MRRCSRRSASPSPSPPPREEDGGERRGARKRAVSRVVGEVAAYLGNTPAVARASYIDPRIVEQYERGVTIAPILTELGEDTEFGEFATQGRAEEAVRRLLTRLA